MYYNITEIGVIGCNETMGVFQFWIGAHNLIKIYPHEVLTINLESPANGQLACLPNGTNFTCCIFLNNFPLTEKLLSYPKKRIIPQLTIITL